MNLTEIKNYLMQVKIASISSLTTYFKCDTDVLRCMLSHWMRKGCVRQVTGNSNCGSCSKCPKSGLEIYEWLGQPAN